MGIFDGVQSALSSAFKTATSWAGGAISTATSWASGAASTVSNAAGSLPRISLPTIPSVSFNTPTLKDFSIIAQTTAQNAVNMVTVNAEKAASTAATAAGKSAEYATAAAANIYRANNGLALIDLSIFDAPAQAVAKAAAAPAVMATQALNTIAPTFAAPDAGKVAAEIAAAATAAPAKVAAAAGGAIAVTTAAIPKISISLPTIPNLSGLSVSSVPGSILPSVSLPGITGPGSVIPNASKGGNIIDQAIAFRNNTYDFGGETFAKGWLGNDAIGAAYGAGIYGVTAAADLLTPADAINLGNKIVTGRANEITSDELIAGGIDVAMIGIGMGTGGTGYVAARGLLKGGNLALAAGKAGAKLSQGVVKTKAVKDAAKIGALAAIGAAGGKMIKLGKITKLIKPEVKAAVKKVAKPSASAAAQTATAAKKAAASVNAAAAARKAQNAATVAQNARKAQNAATAAANAKKVQSAAAAKINVKKAAAVQTAAKKVSSAAPSSSILKTEKAIANDASALKTGAKAEAAAIEEVAKPGSSMMKYGAIALGAGLTGVGLASYLGGSGADQVVDPPVEPTPDPTIPDIGGGDTPSPYLDPAIAELTPEDYTAQMDALDQALADGTITPEQYDQAVEDLQQAQDDAGGNFPAAFGSDTAYQGIEDAAQDATRAIPGDPFAWFRENGLAAPVMGGLIIAVLLVIVWIWKRYAKKGSKGSAKHHSQPKKASGEGSSSGNKIVVV